MPRLVSPKHLSHDLAVFYGVMSNYFPFFSKLSIYYRTTFFENTNNIDLVTPALLINSSINRYELKYHITTPNETKEIRVNAPSLWSSAEDSVYEDYAHVIVNINGAKTYVFLTESGRPIIWVLPYLSTVHFRGLYYVYLLFNALLREAPEVIESINRIKKKPKKNLIEKQKDFAKQVLELLIEPKIAYVDVDGTIKITNGNHSEQVYKATNLFVGVVNYMIGNVRGIFNYYIDSLRNSFVDATKTAKEKIMFLLRTRGYPFVVKDDMIYIVYPFYYKPEYVMRESALKKIDGLRSIKNYYKHFFLAFEIISIKPFRVSVNILDQKLELNKEKMPHFNSTLCTGQIKLRLEYDEVPPFPTFLEKTINPILRSLKIVNLNSAYDSPLTRYLKRVFKKLPDANAEWI